MISNKKLSLLVSQAHLKVDCQVEVVHSLVIGKSSNHGVDFMHFSVHRGGVSWEYTQNKDLSFRHLFVHGVEDGLYALCDVSAFFPNRDIVCS